MDVEPAGIWIERWDPSSGPGPTVGVKDLCDVAGSVTTAGCLALAESSPAARSDSGCVAAVRRAGGRLAGKTNLHELAYGTSGANPWYGMPDNPADPGRVPGGSSSGSAVAVALGQCDVAIGSDTGGSIRIPAACCGVVGLKTTWGRISLDGVWPLAPSFDTVGPMAADVGRTALGLALLEGQPLGQGPDEGAVGGSTLLPRAVGRARLGPQVEIDPLIDEAVDRSLRATSLLSGIEVTEVPVEGWAAGWEAHACLLDAEAWQSDGWLVSERGEGVGDEVRERLAGAQKRSAREISSAKLTRRSFSDRLQVALDRCGVLALPVVPWRPPTIADWRGGFNVLASPINSAGLPALALPVPLGLSGSPPTSLQLVGPAGSEEMLLALGAVVERAVAPLAS